MSKWNKTLAGMRNNPRDGWTISDLETVARRFNIECRKPGGSHATFSHPDVAEIVTVPMKRPIKPFYVQEFVALVDEIPNPPSDRDHE